MQVPARLDKASLWYLLHRCSKISVNAQLLESNGHVFSALTTIFAVGKNMTGL